MKQTIFMVAIFTNNSLQEIEPTIIKGLCVTVK